ncbi:MAG: hypothetical protein U1D30_26595 [Planctomycetota bacterium]
MVDSLRSRWDDESWFEKLWSSSRVVGQRNLLESQATLDETRVQPDFAKDMHRLPENRRQLIFRIRRQLAEGSYDEEAKLELAVERMLEHLGGDAFDVGPRR